MITSILIFVIFSLSLPKASLSIASTVSAGRPELIERATDNFWKWNINPDLHEPSCGVAHTVRATLKAAPKDLATISQGDECFALYNYLLGRANTQWLDLILRCNGDDALVHGGVETEKLDFTYKAATSDAAIDWDRDGFQAIPGRFHVWDTIDGKVVVIADFWAYLGVVVDKDKRKIKYQYFYCF